MGSFGVRLKRATATLRRLTALGTNQKCDGPTARLAEPHNSLRCLVDRTFYRGADVLTVPVGRADGSPHFAA